MGSSAKARRAAEAARTSSGKILRSGVQAMRTVTATAATKATGLTSRVSLRPLVIGLLLLALLFLGITCLGKFQLWMTAAGLFMVAMSVASAVQEFQLPKTVQSYQDFLDEEMEHCGTSMVTLPHLSPVKASRLAPAPASASATQQQMAQERASNESLSSMALNIASPAILSPSTSSSVALTDSFAASSVQQKPSTSSRRQSEDIGALESAVSPASVNASRRRNSNSTNELSSKLDVLHCGTVIDIQGSRGFIIPHDLRVEEPTAKTQGKLSRISAAAASRSSKQQKMPLVIPFSLAEEPSAARQEIAVGKTVEFAYSKAAGSSDARASVRARNVTPVPSDDGIRKSRSALQSCKQAREVSFARAMEELTMISPRNVPVKHCVDLIKYAEQLDDHDAPGDQCI